MAQIIDFKKKDELIPIDEWDGECWKTMFDTLAELLPDQDPWETLANFIKVAIWDNEK